MRGATVLPPIISLTLAYFNPRSPCGERHFFHDFSLPFSLFQSTLPMRGATFRGFAGIILFIFQSTLPMRGATSVHFGDNAVTLISIHAPHAGSDFEKFHFVHAALDFNPRSPCGERRKSLVASWVDGLFQSTLPMRGATLSTPAISVLKIFQSTLPMRGATFVCR